MKFAVFATALFLLTPGYLANPGLVVTEGMPAIHEGEGHEGDEYPSHDGVEGFHLDEGVEMLSTEDDLETERRVCLNPRWPLLCPNGRHCCNKRYPWCCPTFCCPRGFPYCGRNGRCYAKFVSSFLTASSSSSLQIFEYNLTSFCSP